MLSAVFTQSAMNSTKVVLPHLSDSSCLPPCPLTHSLSLSPSVYFPLSLSYSLHCLCSLSFSLLYSFSPSFIISFSLLALFCTSTFSLFHLFSLVLFFLLSLSTSLYFPFLSRSEEPTSELQSPLIISYAVFCLTQKLSHFT